MILILPKLLNREEKKKTEENSEQNRTDGRMHSSVWGSVIVWDKSKNVFLSSIIIIIIIKIKMLLVILTNKINKINRVKMNKQINK